MKTVAAIHDLSCHAKSSLTVVLPVLSAMGVDASVLPTALLSTQTDGFDDYRYFDVTDIMESVLSHWVELDLRFDCIYSGFLGSQRQIDIVSNLIVWQRGKGSPLVVVDPVLGDQGEPYGPVSDDLIERMACLVSMADVITPNLTEAALLLKESYRADLSLEEASGWARRLSSLGPGHVAITGVMDKTDGLVVGYDRILGETFRSRQAYAPVSYPGCGDLFASILCALMLRRIRFSRAVDTAAALVSQAVHASWQAGVETRHGVAVELIIPSLAEITR